MLEELFCTANQEYYSLAYLMLYAEINTACLCLLLIIWVRSGRELAQSSLRLCLRGVIGTTSVVILSDLLWFLVWQEVLPGGLHTLMLLKSMYFLFNTWTGCAVLMYFEQLLGRWLPEGRVSRGIFALPLVLHLILTLVNLSHPILFGYRLQEGFPSYYRGSLFLLNYLPTFFYTAVIVFPALVRCFQKKHYASREKNAGAVIFFIAPIIASILQFYLKRIPFLCFGMTIGIWVQYMDQLSLMISRDALTGLMNRRQLIRELDRLLSEHGSDARVAVLLIDIDFFKKINDRYGHATGDAAIVTAAEILQEAARLPGMHSSVCRYGGDEFVIALCGEGQKSAEAIRTRIVELAAHTLVPGTDRRLHFSVGIADNGDTAEMSEILERADAAMYDAKRARHALRR